MIFTSVKKLRNFTKQHAMIIFYVNCIRISALNKGYSLSITVMFIRNPPNNMIVIINFVHHTRNYNHITRRTHTFQCNAKFYLTCLYNTNNIFEALLLDLQLVIHLLFTFLYFSPNTMTTLPLQ